MLERVARAAKLRVDEPRKTIGHPQGQDSPWAPWAARCQSDLSLSAPVLKACFRSACVRNSPPTLPTAHARSWVAGAVITLR